MTAPALQSNSSEPHLVDFRRPHRVAKERLRALEVMHERLVKSLEGWMLSRVRGHVELRLGPVKQSTFAEFAQTLRSPCCSYLIDIKDCGGQQGVIDFGLDLAYFLVDRLFGGHGDPTILDRSLSPIERMALRVVAEHVLKLVQESWQERIALVMELSGFESVPEILQSGSRETTVLHVDISVMFAGKPGKISISLPMIALENFFASDGDPRKSSLSSIGSEQELSANRELTEAQLRATSVKVRACLPDFRLTMREIAGIQAGMVLPTGIAVGAPIQAYVGDAPRFRCAAGRVGSKLAVRILDSIDAPLSGAHSPNE